VGVGAPGKAQVLWSSPIATPRGSGQGTAPNVPISIQGCQPDLFYVSANGASALGRAAYVPSVDLTGLSLRQLLASTVSASNVTAGTTVTVEQRLAIGGFFLASSGAKRVDAAAATVALPQLDGVEQLVVTAVTGANRTELVAARSAYASDLANVDASVGLIAAVGAKPVFTPAAITWVEATPGAPDLVINSLAVTRGGPADPKQQVRAHHDTRPTPRPRSGCRCCPAPASCSTRRRATRSTSRSAWSR
jgi:hypothetical protein